MSAVNVSTCPQIPAASLSRMPRGSGRLSLVLLDKLELELLPMSLRSLPGSALDKPTGPETRETKHGADSCRTATGLRAGAEEVVGTRGVSDKFGIHVSNKR